MPDDLSVKQKAWMHSIEEINQFATLHNLPSDDPPTELPKDKPSGSSENSMRDSAFKKLIIENIRKLDQMANYLQEATINEKLKEAYHDQMRAMAEARKGWGKIIKLRKLLMDMGGNDFFELFDDYISNQCL